MAGVLSGLAPIGGLAVGVLVCGALVEYGPRPEQLVYALILVGLAAAAVVVARMPETSPRVPGALQSLVPKVGVPARVRPEILAMVPILIATWALGGLYLSLGPSVAAQIFAMPNHVIGGLVVALLFRHRRDHDLPPARLVAAALACLRRRRLRRRHGADLVGLVVELSALAAFEERGELFAAFYLISYLAFSLPALAAGFADTSLGLRTTAIVYGAVVLLLSLAAIVAQRRLVAQRAAATQVPG